MGSNPAKQIIVFFSYILFVYGLLKDANIVVLVLSDHCTSLIAIISIALFYLACSRSETVLINISEQHWTS